MSSSNSTSSNKMVPPTVHDSSPNNSDSKCFIKTISSKRTRNSSDDSEVGTTPRSNRVSKPKSKRFLSGENFMKKGYNSSQRFNCGSSSSHSPFPLEQHFSKSSRRQRVSSRLRIVSRPQIDPRVQLYRVTPSSSSYQRVW